MLVNFAGPRTSNLHIEFTGTHLYSRAEQHAPISFQSLNLTVHEDDDDNDDAKNLNLSNSLGLVNFTVRLDENPYFA